MEYKIGSWNLRHFSHTGTHDMRKIAEVITKEGFDVIALQEVKTREAVQYLLKKMPSYWQGFYGDARTGRGTKHGELSFAYLWNTKRLRECSKGGEPLPLDGKFQSALSRRPFYGRFTPSGLGGSFFEIRLLNIHLIHGGDDSPASMALRIEEFKQLTGEIYANISHRRYGVFMPGYTVILGDYNLSCTVCNDIESTMMTYHADTVLHERTTLGGKDLKNDYDHFGYNKERFSESLIITKSVDTLNDYMGGDRELHREKLSDHLPIKMTLNLNNRRA